MTSIIWHIYTQYLKKEKVAIEAARRKNLERRERNRKLLENGPGQNDAEEDFFRT